MILASVPPIPRSDACIEVRMLALDADITERHSGET